MTESDILRIWNGPTSHCNRAKLLKFAADLESRLRAESAQEPVAEAWVNSSGACWEISWLGPVCEESLGLKPIQLYAAPVAKPAAQDCLARYGIHSDGQPLTPYGVQLIDDLAGLVRRLMYQLKKHDLDNQLVAQADEYLRSRDLQGNPLRDDEGPAEKDCVSVPREPTAEQVSNGELAMLEIMYPDETNFASSEKGRACAERCYRAMLAASEPKT